MLQLFDFLGLLYKLLVQKMICYISMIENTLGRTQIFGHILKLPQKVFAQNLIICSAIFFRASCPNSMTCSHKGLGLGQEHLRQQSKIIIQSVIYTQSENVTNCTPNAKMHRGILAGVYQRIYSNYIVLLHSLKRISTDKT